MLRCSQLRCIHVFPVPTLVASLQGSRFTLEKFYGSRKLAEPLFLACCHAAWPRPSLEGYAPDFAPAALAASSGAVVPRPRNDGG